ncbi:MAG: type II toxin-antitoxin system VapC family toxin [Bifidobacteriaceae bacterium]|jgi:PIN domain nuclease of toxin-antitoxin system|nr:type II toxin-antitoxin system VapC family toxin [Bifidobacteriaceae bacterium]
MKLLLDTNVLLWTLQGSPRLEPYRAAVTDPAHTVYFSAISVAEISLKSSLGKLDVQPGYVDALTAAGYVELPFTTAHAQTLATLPWHHRDPFDRLIIAQAICDNLTVATADHTFTHYRVPLLGT